MEKDLISKKDLLELTGISYGQLYRWKRKNLIPEEWFIRKSAFTGQETFFPKYEVLARINKIQNMKDDLSLDEIAGMFSSSPIDVALSKDEIVKRNIVSNVVLEIGDQVYGAKESLPFELLFPLYVADKLLHSGEISIEEGRTILQVVSEHYPKLQEKPFEFVVLRKLGISVCLLVVNGSDMAAEKGCKVVARLHMGSCMEELKVKVTEG
ncbi:YhbD family protein [Ectobacillus panaciterrae]|uniref:YhbD family protein n=1 Tax=Ectobacillus panaciterrae TaxID=363872 RepID=UPI0003F95804|nr:YhbD family protein [Ectobacillus panaciterrae]